MNQAKKETSNDHENMQKNGTVHIQGNFYLWLKIILIPNHMRMNRRNHSEKAIAGINNEAFFICKIMHIPT